MDGDPDLQNNYQSANQYTPGGYEKVNRRKIILIMLGVFIVFALVIAAVIPASQQDKYTKSATAAARKHTPHAEVSNVKVAGGFATALVSDPTAQGKANDGNTTVFKVNNDGSMEQLAKGSSFGPIDLLELGMPLATQAKLTGTSIGSVKQNLENQCGYSNGAIGYNGFSGTFDSGLWQIDAGTLDILMQKLSKVINNQSNGTPGSKSVICVNAIQKNSGFTTDKATFISTYTLQVQFITGEGTLTTHTITFTNSSPRFRTYTLDGQNI